MEINIPENLLSFLASPDPTNIKLGIGILSSTYILRYELIQRKQWLVSNYPVGYGSPKSVCRDHFEKSLELFYAATQKSLSGKIQFDINKDAMEWSFCVAINDRVPVRINNRYLYSLKITVVKERKG